MRLPGLSPFSLDHAHALPVTGAHHPLRQEFYRWMSWGNAATMMIALTALVAFLCLRREPVAPNMDHIFTINFGDDFGIKKPPVPPSISVKSEKTSAPDPSTVGVPLPVEDWKALVSQFPTADQMTAAYDDLGKLGSDVAGGGDLSVLPNEPSLPTPDQFVAVEVEPKFLRMVAPVYPSLAREAGIEGTVLLRVLVSKEGKVLNVIVLSGNPMLAESARTAALTAQFSPAMQQHKPVPVWVQLPVVFSLK